MKEVVLIKAICLFKTYTAQNQLEAIFIQYDNLKTVVRC